MYAVTQREDDAIPDEDLLVTYRKPPTIRQLAVLRFVVEHTRDFGRPPTLREIGNAVRIRSTNGVTDHLRALQRRGLITREDMKTRTLRATAEALDLVGVAANEVPGGPALSPTSSTMEREVVRLRVERDSLQRRCDYLEGLLARIARAAVAAEEGRGP